MVDREGEDCGDKQYLYRMYDSDASVSVASACVGISNESQTDGHNYTMHRLPTQTRTPHAKYTGIIKIIVLISPCFC